MLEVVHVDGASLDGKILRRIVEVRIVVGEGKPLRRVRLNCGHTVDVERRMRPTIGKLTGCPRCR